MSDTVANAQSSIPLSQMERVIDTFVAPSKTFHDILRSASWWLPWLLGVLVTLGFSVRFQVKEIIKLCSRVLDLWISPNNRIVLECTPEM